MLPGKTYSPDEVIGILRRRIWWVLVPLAVVSATTAAASRVLPDLYEAEAVVAVVPQRVPEAYVRPTVTTGLGDRLRAMQAEVLSRTRLEALILELNLYADRREQPMADIVEQMRDDIGIDASQDVAFVIEYVSRDPQTAMTVANRLAADFIAASLVDRSSLADETNQFLESQLQIARQRLLDHEKTLEAYRIRHAGELPAQLPTNMQAVQNLSMQVQAVLQTVNNARERKLLLERQLDEADTEAPPVAVEEPGSMDLNTLEQLDAARTRLVALRARLTAQHPDVQHAERQVRDLEARAAAEARAAGRDPSAPAISPAEAVRQARIKELRGGIAELDDQIARGLDEEARLRAEISAYQDRIDEVPTRESELTSLMRDYDDLASVYSDLLRKNEEAKVAANLEHRQIGEQFRLLDAARLPEIPTSPNRLRINILGIVGGLGLGLALVGLLEYRDGSFKTDMEIRQWLSLPVLAVVPLMHSDRERQRLWRRSVAINIGLGSTVLACAAVVVYTLVR